MFFNIFIICIATSFLKISNTTAYITTLTNITAIVVIHILSKNIFIIHADMIIHNKRLFQTFYMNIFIKF